MSIAEDIMIYDPVTVNVNTQLTKVRSIRRGIISVSVLSKNQLEEIITHKDVIKLDHIRTGLMQQTDQSM